MTRFIAIHSTAPEATQDQLINSARKVMASLSPGTEWLNSWVVPELDKVFCEWKAPNPEAIRTALEPAKDQLPIESLYEVEWIDPRWYE